MSIVGPGDPTYFNTNGGEPFFSRGGLNMRIAHWLCRVRQTVAAQRSKLRQTRRIRAVEVFEARLVLTGPGQIDGTVWLDANADGVFDQATIDPPTAGESGLEGATVFLDLDRDGVFDAPVSTVTSDDVPQPIFDVASTTSTTTVAGLVGNIVDVDVTVDITHTFRADLRLLLTSPSGKQISLVANAGGDADNYSGTIFDDEAADLIVNAAGSATGRFRPLESLSSLDGDSPLGRWQLTVSDDFGPDPGTLNGWSLTITTDDAANTEPHQLTNASGGYSFSGLDVGEYDIGLVLGSGLRRTFPVDENSQTVVLSASVSTASDVNFGVTFLPGTIRGQVFSDVDGSGFRDFEEPGSNGITVNLIDPETQAVIRSTQTAAIDLNGDLEFDPNVEWGIYEFTDLPPGDYVVALEASDDRVTTSPRPTNLGPTITQAGTYTATQPPVGTVDNPAQLLPDLIVNMESGFGLRDWFLDGSVIRFGQATPNVGHGAMHLVGGADQGDGTQLVSQRIFDDQGGFTDRTAGFFEFHPEHNHLHFNDYAQYSLRAALPDATGDDVPEVGDVVRSGEKTSFCLINVAVFDSSLPNFDADGSPFGCSVEQQISVGWEDIYGAFTEGQEINIAGLEPGQYWLEAVIDPDNHFLELDESNNFGRVLVTVGPGLRVHNVTVTPASVNSFRDFGVFDEFSISGTVFNDQFGDGNRQANEPGLAQRIVFLDLNGDGILNNPTSGDNVADGLAQEPWDLTDGNGDYRFDGIGPGSYRVRTVLGSGEQLTSNSIFVTGRSGQDVGLANIGIGVPEPTVGVTLVNGVLTLTDVVPGGLSNDIVIDSGSASFFFITDRVGVFGSDVGTRIDLHTISVPKSDVTSIVINTGDGADNVNLVSNAPNLTAIAHMIESPAPLLLNSVTAADVADDLPPGKDDPVTHDFDIDQDGDFDLVDSNLVLATIQSTAEVNAEVVFTGFVINAGSGNDSISHFGPEAATIQSGAGNDHVFVQTAQVVLDAGTGNDFIELSAVATTLNGGDGDDQLNVFGNVDLTLTNSLLTGGLTAALSSIEGVGLFGGHGSNRLDASLFTAGRVSLFGGSGDDTLLGTSGTDFLEGDSFPFADIGNDVLIGNGGADEFVDFVGQNTFVITPDALADIVSANGVSSIQLAFGSGNDNVIVTGSGEVAGDTGPVFQPATVTNNGVLILNVFGEPLLDISLNGGNDRLTAALDLNRVDPRLSVHGGSGNDTLSGSLGQDFLDGEAGNDSLVGNSGDDTLYGGAGNDSLFGGNGNDTVFGMAGNFDVVSGGFGDDIINGGTGTGDLLVETVDVDVAVTVTFGAQTSDGLGADRFSNVEGLNVTGGPRADLLDASLFTVGLVTLSGGNGNDTLIGTVRDDILNGDAGDDSVTASRGADRIFGGAGADVLRGGDGPDLMDGGDGADQVYGEGNSGDTITGGRGSDTLDGGNGQDVLVETLVELSELVDINVVSSRQSAFLANDSLRLFVDNFFEFSSEFLSVEDRLNSVETVVLNGSDENEYIDGSLFTRGSVTLNGNSGEDTLLGGSRNDVLAGGDGSDFVFQTFDGTQVVSNSTLTGRGTDALTSIERVFLDGGAAANLLDARRFSGETYLYGEDGNDTLLGGTGPDFFIGGLGNDSINGGSGSDLAYEFNLRSARVTDSLMIAKGSDSLTSIERVELNGTNDTDEFDLSAFSGLVRAFGFGGNDRFVVSPTTFGELIGDVGNDTVVVTGNSHFTLDAIALRQTSSDGSVITTAQAIEHFGIESAVINDGALGHRIDASFFPGQVTINGGDGPDTIFGSDFADSLNGGLGNDVIHGRGGDDLLFGEAGADSITGGDGNDRLAGQGASDILQGNGGADTITGGNGDDIISGATFGTADSNITGLAADGNDSINGDAGNDVLVGGSGNDFLSGDQGNDVISGGDGNDNLIGAAGNDTLLGDAGADIVGGGSGRDLLLGGDGNDTLAAGSDSDIDSLDGGAGTNSLSSRSPDLVGVFTFDLPALLNGLLGLSS